MTLLRALGVLLLALGLQAALVRIWPGAPRFVGLMMLPVIWYALVATPRAAMLVGAAGGLMHDAWFQVAAFGITGFELTLLGWVLGGFGSRFDLNNQAGRLVSGALFPIAMHLLDVGLRRLFDLASIVPSIWELLAQSLITALLTGWSFGVVQRIRERYRIGN